MSYLLSSTISKRQLRIENEINELCRLIQKFIFCLSNPKITVEKIIEDIFEEKDLREVYEEEYLSALVRGNKMDDYLEEIYCIYYKASDKFLITQKEWEKEIKNYLRNKRKMIEEVKDFISSVEPNIAESALFQLGY